MYFEFATAGRIIFGPGTIKQLPELAAGFGRNACVITGSHPERAAGCIDALQKQGVACHVLTVKGEPTTHIISELTESALDFGCDMVIALGGGSVIDSGKALAAMLTNPGRLMDYLEVIGAGKPLAYAPAAFITIPTTAGTGAEVTRNAVLSSPEHHVKVSLRSALMLPRITLVDPELTHGLPRTITAASGMDALTQLLEAYVTHRHNPFTDSLCREGLMRAGRSLHAAWLNGAPDAREDMSLAGLFSGLALANAGLGAVHGFAGTIGGMFDAPHGFVCARLLPFVMQANINAMRQRESGNPALERYAGAAEILTGIRGADVREGIAWVDKLCAEFDVPPLRDFGFNPDDIPAVIAQARKASSMRGNPVELTDSELHAILQQAL